MWSAALVLAFVACATAQSLFHFDLPGILGKKYKWNDFKNTYGKSYETKEEDERRYHIYLSNALYIEVHNAHEKYDGRHGYELGVNELADLTTDEFRKLYNGYRMRAGPRNGSAFFAPEAFDAPKTVDWRPKGYVTPVKNQGQCGSCWAFSTTGSLEGQHFKKTGKLVSLSEQNLVDCAGGKYGNLGCNGGLMDQAFSYIKDNGGIDTEKSYPYTGRNGKCRFSKPNVGATDTGFVDIPSGDEDALAKASATVGPISVAIDAGHITFQLYRRGVYNPWFCSSTNLDHGVLVVGYGTTDDGKDYWLVKNSWGGSWGDKGYIKMARNAKNKCGIATNASYPLV